MRLNFFEDGSRSDITKINPSNFTEFFPKVYTKLSLPASSILFTDKNIRLQDQISQLESLRARCEEVQLQAIVDVKKNPTEITNKYGIDPESLKKVLIENQIIREKYLADLIRAKGYDVSYDSETRIATIDYGSGKKIYGTVYSIIDAHPDLLDFQGVSKEFETKPNPQFEKILAIKSREGSAFKASMALSGSFAQKEINPNPADFDFTEYIDIESDNFSEGAEIFRKAILDNFENFKLHANIHLIEFKFGRFTFTDKEGKKTHIFLQWTKEEIEKGFKDITFEGQVIRVDFETHLKNLGPRDMIKFDLITNISGTFKDCSKIINLRIQDTNKNSIFEHRASYSPLQEVYYEDPIDFEIIKETSDLNVFTNYYSNIFGEALKYSQCDEKDISHSENCNPLKSAKRIYTFLKTQGRIQEAREISKIFDSEYSKLYQVCDSLKVLSKVIELYKYNQDNLINLPNIITSLQTTTGEIMSDNKFSKYKFFRGLLDVLTSLQNEKPDLDKILDVLKELQSKIIDKVNLEIYKFLIKQSSYINVLENSKIYFAK